MKKTFLLLTILFSVMFAKAQTSGDWSSLGPTDIPSFLNWQLSGVARISQMKFHPTDTNTLYAVNAMGGLFISRDKGANWVSTGADNLPQTRCASVCIDYTDDHILYLGTGDPSYYSQGYGIWKSTDGGFNWSLSTYGMSFRLPVEILMSPLDHNVLITATDDGIWKSTDGGSNWVEKKSGGDFTDMVFKPANNSSTIYATTHTEFWRSDDMGETWTLVSLPGSGFENGGRIAVSKADPSVVYVTFVGDFGSSTSTPVLKSSDSGQNFTIMKAAGGTNLNGYDGNSNGQGNYNYAMSADPANINHLFIAGHIIWESIDGGANWNQVSVDWAHQVHSDMRQIPFSPYSPNEIYNINDGGIWRSWDKGQSWLPICNGLVGTESYIGCQSPVRKDEISIGAQDNGEFLYRGGIWYNNGAGDYHSNIIHDNISSDYYYDLSGSGRRRGLPSGPDYSLNLPFDAGNGQSVFSSFPLSSTQTAFLGYTDVYISTNITNNPPTWTKITNFNTQIKALASSPLDANVLYVVTNDGKIRRSDNALSATPTFTTYNTPSATNVTASVVVLKSNTNVVYMVCNNKVYRSADKGATWTDVSGGLPSLNYHTILQDVYSVNEAIYLAGYNAVYYKDNTLSTWAKFANGLPTVVSFYRFYMYNDGTDNSELTFISAGRGVWHTGLYGRTPVLRIPENPEDVITGIIYNYYEGNWNSLPNFNSLTPVKTGTVPNVDLSVREQDDYFAFTFDGYIDVPTDGKYTFYTSSDDGSMFYIGNQVIVNNDGLHGNTEQNGYIWLKHGKHKFTLTFFENTVDQSLTFSWEGPGISKEVVPSERLYRLSPASVCPENGLVSVEFWQNASGNSVSDIPVTTTPSLTFNNPNFESKTDNGDNYGERYRGYFCPPYTGNYVFYVSSDDDSELWLSTDGDPANKVRITYLNGAVDLRNFYDNPSQTSDSIYLKAGQKYYIEGLHKEGGGDDHFTVACKMPSGEFQVPLEGKHLSPFKNNTFPTVSISAPANDYAVVEGTNITVNVDATDADGSVSMVEFFLDDIKMNEDNTAPYSWAWNSVSAGTYKLTARAVDNLGAVSVSSIINVTVVTLRTPENPALTKHKINYQYYESSTGWTTLPDFTTLTPVKSDTVSYFSIAVRNRDTQYGISFSGLIDIPADGIYKFYISSDDGSKLYFGNRSQLLLYNDGPHINTSEISAWMGLKQGKHQIVVDYFQNSAGENLTVSYEGNGIPKQEIPTSVLYREVTSNVHPTITLSSDSRYGISPASFTLTADAVDSDGTVMKVNFYSNGLLIGQSTTSPFVLNWNNVATGTYSITARAYDDNNDSTTSNSISIQVNDQDILPTVSLASDVTTAKSPATFNLTATASDTDGSISKVEYYANGQLIGQTSSAPYTLAWSNSTIGSYSVIAKAYDNMDSNSTSNSITLTVSNPNQLPTISITSPTDQSHFNEPVTLVIDATASDPDGTIQKVEFYNGSVMLAFDNSAPYSYTWTGVTSGTYTITAKAYDDNNAVQTSVSITVTIDGVSSITNGFQNLNNQISVFPNPVINSATITFNVEHTSNVRLVLYDMKGVEIKVLENNEYAPGSYSRLYDFKGLSDGAYLLKTTIGTQTYNSRVINSSKPKNSN